MTFSDTSVTIANPTIDVTTQIAPSDVEVQLDSDIEVIQINEQGPPGLPGPQGPQGVAGNTILSGEGPPPYWVGADGDYYVDRTNHAIFGPRTNGYWPPTGLIMGGIPDAPWTTEFYARINGEWQIISLPSMYGLDDGAY